MQRTSSATPATAQAQKPKPFGQRVAIGRAKA